jgi:chromosome segregation ATPase
MIKLSWTPEERDDLRKTFEGSTGDWFEMALKVANHAISLFRDRTDRMSGQVKEDERAVRSVFDHACAVDGELTGKPCRACDVETGAFSRLSVLAKDTAQSRAATAQAWQEATDLRERLSRQSARAQEYLDETERLKSEIHKLINEKGEINREAESLRARVKELEKDIWNARLTISHWRGQAEGFKAERDALESGATLATLKSRVNELEGVLSTERDAHEREKRERERNWADLRTARAEVERLTAELQRMTELRDGYRKGGMLEHERAKSAESRLAAIRARYADGVGIANAVDRDRKQAAEYEVVHTESSAVVAGIRWVLEGDEPQEVKAQQATTPELDAQQRWMSEHPEEIEKHRGKHVAVHAVNGIVASNASYAQLIDELEAEKIPDNQVVIEYIPHRRGPIERERVWKAMHPNGSCTCGGEGTCPWCNKASRVCENCEKLQERHDSLANEIAKMGPIAKDLLVAQARIVELEPQLAAARKERDEFRESWRALDVQAASATVLVDELRAKVEKYRKRAAKWKRRAQEAALDFYEGFLIGHKIGQAMKKETPPLK